MAGPKKIETPLAFAAAALEDELRQYQESAEELAKIVVTTDKTLQRARRALEQCGAHQEKLATLLPAFAEAMQRVQVVQQQCMDVTSREATKIEARFHSRLALLERVATLGNHAKEINEPVAAVLSLEQGTPAADLHSSLKEVSNRTEAVIDEAEALKVAAEEAEWADIARDADVLKQQLQAARNKILVAQRNVAARSPS